MTKSADSSGYDAGALDDTVAYSEFSELRIPFEGYKRHMKAVRAKVRRDAIEECARIAVREQAYWRDRDASGSAAAENIEFHIRKLAGEK